MSSTNCTASPCPLSGSDAVQGSSNLQLEADFDTTFISNFISCEKCNNNNNSSVKNSQTINQCQCNLSCQSSQVSSPSNNLRPNLHIYTDGSHLTRSSNPAGWGFVSVMNEDDDNVGTEIHRSNGVVVLDATYPGYLGMQVHTNNTGELSAFGECLYWLYEQPVTDVTIFADSAYVINTIQGTFNGEANKTAYIIIRNLYQYVSKKHNINIQHVRSHTGNVWNSVADMLAKEGAKPSLNL